MKPPHLLPNWKAVLTKAWSIRFIVLAGILQGIDLAFTLLAPAKASVGFVVAAAISTVLAFVARLYAQANLPKE